MITKKGIAFILMVAVLFLLVLVKPNQGILILVSMMGGIILISILSPWLGVLGLSLRRVVPPECFEGETCTATIKVCNNNWVRKYFLSFSDHFLSSKTPVHFVVNRLPGNSTLEVSYKLQCSKRGFYPGGIVEVTSGFPFGFFKIRRRLNLESLLKVYPRYFELKSLPLMESDSTPLEVFHERGLKRKSFEYYGPRCYLPGDSLSLIHWRSTAHTGRLMVKEFEKEAFSPLTIILDSQQMHLLKRGVRTGLEEAISATASIANYALTSGHSLNLIWARKQELRFLIRPNWWQILEELAQLQVSSHLSLKELVEKTLFKVSPRSSVFLITSTFNSDSKLLLETCSLLQERRNRVLVLLILAHTFSQNQSQGTKKFTAMKSPEVAELSQALINNRVLLYHYSAGDELKKCLEQPVSQKRQF